MEKKFSYGCFVPIRNLLLLITIAFPIAVLSQSAAQRLVTGLVTNDKGEKLPGVTVLVKGSTAGTTTDGEGRYSIKVPQGAGVLVFTFVGMATQEVAIGNKTTVNAVLLPREVAIDELVVVGYGTTSRKELISSVSTVNMGKIAAQPAQSINDLLGGRTQGIIVTNSGGGPGKKAEISIRGGGEPLFVIDGVVRSKNDYNNINPNDIEKLSILKDATATAIYGARAGNGIVEVTTRQGMAGRSIISATAFQSWSRPTILPSKLGSYERAMLVNEMRKNEGLPPTYSDEVLGYYRDQTKPYEYPDVNWQRLAMKRFAPEARYDLNASGGNEQLRYYTGLSAYNQGTILKTDRQQLDRYTFRLNVTSTFKSIGLKVLAGADGFIEKQEQPNSGYAGGNVVWSHIQNTAPWIGAYAREGQYSINTDHPLVTLDSRSGYIRNQSRVVNTRLNFEYQVPGISGLTLRYNNTYNFYSSFEKSWNITAPQFAIGSNIPNYVNNPDLSKTWGEGQAYTLQGIADYSRVFGRHSLSLMAGGEQYGSRSSNLSASRVRYQILFDQFNAGPIENMTNGSGEGESARAGYFGRLKYGFGSRYLVEATFRYDGSDNFAKGRRWGFFYAGSVAWNITEEAFMRQLTRSGLLSSLKLRASYGITGLDGVDRYKYVPGYSINGTAYVVNGKLMQGFSEGELVSTDMSWYSVRTLNYGADLALLNNRLSLSWDYFYYRRTGFIASPSGTRYTDPLGTSLPMVNTNGAHRRAGTELSISFRDQFRGLSYEVGSTFTYFDQLWERKPDEDISVLKNPYRRAAHRTGYSGIAYFAQGYYANADDVMQLPKRGGSTNLTAGDLKYLDFNGDGQIDGNDQIPIGKNTFPRINYSIYADLSYRGFSLNLLFRGSGNRDIYLGGTQQGSHDTRIIYEFQRDYWTPSNTDAKFPRLTSNNAINGNNNYVSSNHWIISGRYFRLSSLQVAYDFKRLLLKRSTAVNGMSLLLSGTNLFTISDMMKYYMDPETGSADNYDYPVQQTFSVGLRLSF